MAESEIVRVALKAILEDSLLQGTHLRLKKALNEVKKKFYILYRNIVVNLKFLLFDCGC